MTTAAAVHGRPWRRLRAAILARSTLCHLCGHEGADQVDHIVPRAIAPHRTLDPTNVAPAHGTTGCPTCGRRCNQSRGDGRTYRGRPRQTTLPLFPTSRRW